MVIDIATKGNRRRRNKVRELISRGYSQYEISTILHISQPTISRDFNYVQKYLEKKNKFPDDDLLDTYTKTLIGLDELIKKIWEIVDSPKVDPKEKNKSINLLSQCMNQRIEVQRVHTSIRKRIGQI